MHVFVWTPAQILLNQLHTIMKAGSGNSIFYKANKEVM